MTTIATIDDEDLRDDRPQKIRGGCFSPANEQAAGDHTIEMADAANDDDHEGTRKQAKAHVRIDGDQGAHDRAGETHKRRGNAKGPHISAARIDPKSPRHLPIADDEPDLKTEGGFEVKDESK